MTELELRTSVFYKSICLLLIFQKVKSKKRQMATLSFLKNPNVFLKNESVKKRLSSDNFPVDTYDQKALN